MILPLSIETTTLIIKDKIQFNIYFNSNFVRTKFYVHQPSACILLMDIEFHLNFMNNNTFENKHIQLNTLIEYLQEPTINQL